MPDIRVLVVEDSLTIRKYLCEVLARAPGMVVVGDAEDGRRAIELCAELRPDAVTMDMMLPLMSGLAATEYIMAHCPTPILIVSASTNRGELFRTYDALAAGAVDVLEKPRGDETDSAWERKLVDAVKMVSRIRVITHPRARLSTYGRSGTSGASGANGAGATMGTKGAHEAGASRVAGEATKRTCEVVAIGASTGGPAAVVDILRALPAEFRIPILLVVHIGEPFGVAFADWLDGQTTRRVSYAREGEPVAALVGRVAMAPPGRHLVVRAGRLRLTEDAERHSCRPSVDVLFESLAPEYGAAVTACLLTGMGRDGASGMLAIHRAGGLTLAQDEASCVVYGMPREAVQLGAAERVLPLNEIGPALVRRAQQDAVRLDITRPDVTRPEGGQ